MLKIATLALALALLAALAGCSAIAPYTIASSYCSEAEKQGWCSKECGSRQPIGCGKLKLLSCSDLMCMYEDQHGNVIFSGFISDRE